MRTHTPIRRPTVEKSPPNPLGFSLRQRSLSLSSRRDSPYPTEEQKPAVLTTDYNFSQVLLYSPTHPPIQAKLTIGKPNDKYEQEADRVAEQVMRMPNPISSVNAVESPKIQRLCNECEEKLQRQPKKPEDEEDKQQLQAKSISDSSPSLSPDIQARITGLQQGSGQPLPVTERAFFEPRFGHNFSQVKIHTDTRAADTARGVNARAFTVGRDIVFGAGQYQPRSPEGQRLLAHELTHVVQQSGELVTTNEQVSQQPFLKATKPVNVGEKDSTKTLRKENGDEPKLLTDFATKFSDAAALIRKSEAAMKLVLEAEKAGVKFGGFSEDGPAKRAWPYTIGDTIYVPKARLADNVMAMKGFLFEINNAIRAPKFAEIRKEAAKGSGGTLTAKQYAYKIVEQEVEGMLRLGEVWLETKPAIGGQELDKYDRQFYLTEYQAFKDKQKTKEDIINDVLQRVRKHEPHPEWTVEQFYMDQYNTISGGK